MQHDGRVARESNSPADPFRVWIARNALSSSASVARLRFERHQVLADLLRQLAALDQKLVEQLVHHAVARASGRRWRPGTAAA